MDTEPSSGVQAHRSLAAIVFTDAVGFSARVGDDEDGTVALIKKDLDLMSELCRQFEGQVVKSRGDGLMMIFVSAVQAVSCGMEIQKALAERSREEQTEDALLHRIGIHLGDVLISDGDALGDGVNVAARLEQEAEPGGICMSQTVYDVVKSRLFLQAEKIGDLRLKNISEPVAAYRVSGISRKQRKNAHGIRVHWAWITAMGVALVAFGGIATAVLISHRAEPTPSVAPPPTAFLVPPLFDPKNFPLAGGGGQPGQPPYAKQWEQWAENIKKEMGAEDKRMEGIQKAVQGGSRASGHPPTQAELRLPPPTVATPPPPPPRGTTGPTPVASSQVGQPAVSSKSATPPSAESAKFQEAWKSYASRYAFQDMADWVGKNPDAVGAAGTDEVSHYRSLASFTDWLGSELATTSQDHPLAVIANNQNYTVFLRPDGKVDVKTNGKHFARMLLKMRPFMIEGIARSLIAGSSEGKSARSATRGQLRSFVQEFREHSNLKQGATPVSGDNPFDTG